MKREDILACTGNRTRKPRRGGQDGAFGATELHAQLCETQMHEPQRRHQRLLDMSLRATNLQASVIDLDSEGDRAADAVQVIPQICEEQAKLNDCMS